MDVGPKIVFTTDRTGPAEAVIAVCSSRLDDDSIPNGSLFCLAKSRREAKRLCLGASNAFTNRVRPHPCSADALPSEHAANKSRTRRAFIIVLSRQTPHQQKERLPSLPAIPAPASALRAHPCVAISSAQVLQVYNSNGERCRFSTTRCIKEKVLK